MTIEEQVAAIHMKDYWTEEDKRFLNTHKDVNICPKLGAEVLEELNRKAEEEYLAKLKKQEEARERLEKYRAERKKMLAEGLA